MPSRLESNADEQIALWRKRMAEAGMGAQGVLTELESHVREEIQWQLERGLPIDQSIEAALNQIGQPAALAAEYLKLPIETGAGQMKKTAVYFSAVAVLLLALAMILPALAHHGH